MKKGLDNLPSDAENNNDNIEKKAKSQAAPRRKPVIKKVSAAPTKFAPKNPKADAPAKSFIPVDEDFNDDAAADAAAYAAAFAADAACGAGCRAGGCSPVFPG